MGGGCSCQWTVIWKSENMCCWCNVLFCNTLFFLLFLIFMADHTISAMGNYYVVLYLATEDVNWPRKRRKEKQQQESVNIFICKLSFGCSIIIYTKEPPFSLRN